MAKIKVSADTVLSILKGIMGDEEINTTITDTSAPEDWQGKTVQEALNVEYFTFRHRPMDTEYIVKELISQSQSPSSLLALSRSFCLLYLDDVTRSFSKQNDIVTVTANLEYWLQTDKIKLLEDLVEDMTIGTVGERISVQIGTETRQVIMAFGNLNVTEIQDITEFGEMAICELSVEMIFYPVATSLTDYEVAFYISDKTLSTQEETSLYEEILKLIYQSASSTETTNTGISLIEDVYNVIGLYSDTYDDEQESDKNTLYKEALQRIYKEITYSSTSNTGVDLVKEILNIFGVGGENVIINYLFVSVPISGLALTSNMTQKSVPYVNNVNNTGNINLSQTKTIVLTFDGYKNNIFISTLMDFILRSDYKVSDSDGFVANTDEIDNNKEFILRLTRNEDVCYFSCVIKDHQITVQENTGNETHSLTLTARGIKDSGNS